MTPSVDFSQNAKWGIGGQGECLRQMGAALDEIPGARIFSRSGQARRAINVDLHFSGIPEAALFRAVHGLPLVRSRRDWLTLLSDLEFDRRVAARVRSPDLFHGVAGQCNTTFQKLRTGKTIRVLTSLNTHVNFLSETLEKEHRAARGSGHPFLHPRMRQRTLEEISLAHAVRVCSRWAKQTFMERGVPGDKIHVIPHAVDHAHFYPVEKRDDVFRVLAVTSLDLRKGFIYLLQAFEEARIPRSELLLIGATGDRWSKRILQGFLRRNSNIRLFPVHVPGVPVEQTYGRASVFVHPSLEDGLAVVLLEALASGRPVIGTRQSGAGDLVRDGQSGFLVERRSVRDLKDRLLLLSNDRTLLDHMSAMAPREVAHRTYPELARQMSLLYTNLLGV